MRIVQHQLGGLTFTMVRTGIGPADVVESYFELRGVADYNVHRMLARPGQQLHINLADPLEGINGTTGTRTRMQKHLLSGSRTGWFDSKPLGAVHFVGVQFAPMGLHALLGVPQSELVDRDIALDEVMHPAHVEILRERLHEAKDTGSRLHVLREAIMDLGRQRERNADNATMVTRYALAHLQEPMHELERRTGFSRQYLLKLLRERTGLSLQEHRHLQRMERVIALLAEPTMDLADAALQAGFFDQSHFNRHFKRHTGLTPSDYLRSERVRGEPYFS